MENVFYKPKEQYKNELDPIRDWLKQMSKYISLKKGISLEEGEKIAKQILKKEFKDKKVTCFERDDVGDRHVKEETLSSYIYRNIRSNNVIVPTLTTYTNPAKKRSIQSDFIDVNVTLRSKDKKLAAKAKADGNFSLYEEKSQDQGNRKIKNNSLSGIYTQVASILYNPTAHNTLTSITRTITSLSNASNEQLIMGNRYLPRAKDVLIHLVYITSTVNIAEIEAVVRYFKLHVPTVDDVVSVLRYSTDLYFTDKRFYENRIIPLLEAMTPYERAAICYVNDMYHIRHFNPTLIRDFMDKIIRCEKTLSTDKKMPDLGELYKLGPDILNVTHLMMMDTVQGWGVKYDEMNEVGIADCIYRTGEAIKDTIGSLRDLFKAFFGTSVMPSNFFRYKYANRRAVVLSDTDSTCYTLDKWIEWYNHGEFVLTKETITVSAIIAFITSQAIVNKLVIFSKNMNVEESKLNKLSMKNEYFWLAHAPAEVSKHYFAATKACESAVYKEYELECKGVHFINSQVSKEIVDDGKDLMRYILDQIAGNKKISLKYVIDRIVSLENEILSSLMRGEKKYLKTSSIKSPDGYTKPPAESPYQRHLFWVEVFEGKYGEILPPPYSVVKINTKLTTRTAMKEWMNSIEDKEFVKRLEAFIVKYRKGVLPTFMFSEDYITSYGIPAELLPVIDAEKVVFDITKQHRYILEVLGVYLNDTLLIKDQFKNLF